MTNRKIWFALFTITLLCVGCSKPDKQISNTVLWKVKRIDDAGEWHTSGYFQGQRWWSHERSLVYYVSIEYKSPPLFPDEKTIIRPASKEEIEAQDPDYVPVDLNGYLKHFE